MRFAATIFVTSLLSGCAISTNTAGQDDKTDDVSAADVGDHLRVPDNVITNSTGMTVYTYDPEAGALCATGCGGGSMWPPHTYAFNVAPVESATLIELDHGVRQWVIDGHPLHTFSGDKKPGDAVIDGIGGWFVATESLAK